MKFRGQIKVPDVDHPAVGVMAEVEGSHLELFLTEGESLGRWSLADVRADRLVSNAFSLQLGDEEVTFLADDPIDFAYRGVEHMAKEWARYRAMALPRRALATSRSRKDTHPSRISELREAMSENLAGTSVTAIPRAPQTSAPARSLPGVGSTIGSRVKPPEHAAPTPQDEAVDEEMPAIAAPANVEPTEEPTAEKADRGDSVFKDSVPWAKTEQQEDELEKLRAEVEKLRAEAAERQTGRHVEPTPEESVAEEAQEDARALEAEGKELTVEPAATAVDETVSEDEDVPAPWIAPESAEQASEVVESELEDAEAEVTPEPQPEPVLAEAVDEPQSEIDDSADDDASTSSSAEPEDHERYIVDLGAFEGEEPDDEGGRAEPTTVEPDREPAMAAANGKGGLMGAVRSAFVRNKAAHVHEFVEAPGGIGITRQICTECGHISIGVAGSE